jgi:hypothetical protein
MSARNRRIPTSGLIALTAQLWGGVLQAQLPLEGLQLKTLFTTPEERALIDRNRYRKEPRPRKPEPAVELAQEKKPEPQPAAMVSVEKEYRILGVSINTDGSAVAWINGEQFENGDRIDGDIRIRISAGEGRVRLTVPGGRTYSASAGDVIEVSYRKRADE